MRVYFDSSALIKRSVQEAESDAVEEAIAEYLTGDHVVISSSLAWIEVSRALRGRVENKADDARLQSAIDGAMSGVAEYLITSEVIGLAKRIGPARLRTLDALHLATAIVLDADLVVAYDDRLLGACRTTGLSVHSPGR